MDHLVLDIGGDVGALAIYARAGLDGREVEISPAGSGRRVHNVVRPRLAGPPTVYAAVFPGLTAGEYTVWRDAPTTAGTVTAAGTVTVLGGRVTEFHLD